MADASRVLVHYTRTPADVASILTHGFLLVPNPRELIRSFIPDEPFEDREPQQFGMASFSELPVGEARRHREQFGDFGIAVKWSWAEPNHAQRVIYVDHTGEVIRTFSLLFRLAKQQIDESHLSANEKKWLLNNKTMAALRGFGLYANLLTLYEYMQPERDSAQLEWRIVSEIPNYQTLGSRSQMISDLLETRKNWPQATGLGAIPIRPADVEFIVCPRGAIKALRKSLPAAFSNVTIRSYWGRAWLERLAALLELATLRPRRPASESAPRQKPKDLITGVAYVPDMLGITGVTHRAMFVKEDSFLEVCYTGPGTDPYTIRIARAAAAGIGRHSETLENRLKKL